MLLSVDSMFNIMRRCGQLIIRRWGNSHIAAPEDSDALGGHVWEFVCIRSTFIVEEDNNWLYISSYQTDYAYPLSYP